MTAYYNEFDKNAAEWIRNLINAGMIAPGIVDERSIEDVRPDDLDGFTQCHFFAGLGGWSYALRLAGWADHRSAWTASCPCQPYSAAGEGGGFADERHLWPHFEHLLRNQKRRPAIVFGEQVASKFAEPWVDLVHADVEALGYAFGCIPFPSASVGAPHIRDRLYWLADDEQRERGGHVWPGRRLESPIGRSAGGLGHANDPRLERLGVGHQASRGRDGALRPIAATSQPCEFCGYPFDVDNLGRYGCPNCEGDGGLADNDGVGLVAPPLARIHDSQHYAEPRGNAIDELPGPTNGFWRDADWLACRDGKWRPVEPGTFPLAHGVAGRMGRLRAYGNAINAQQAAIFIQSAMSVLD